MPHFHGVSYIIEEKTGCWIVLTNKPTKGGYIYINRIFEKAYLHRLMYVDRIKPLMPGEKVKHTCKNKTCINFDHLYTLKYKNKIESTDS